MSDQLSKTTSIFGLNLWVVVGICVGVAIVLLLFFISLWLTSRRSRTARPPHNNLSSIPTVSKEIQEIQIPHSQVQPEPFPDSNPIPEEDSLIGYNRIHIETGKDHRISYPERYYGSSSYGSGGEGASRSGDQVASVVPEVSHLGWGHWYTLRELKASTNEFADENVIGEGGYGIVYYGLLEDNTRVAVKNLLNNRCILILFLLALCEI